MDAIADKKRERAPKAARTDAIVTARVPLAVKEQGNAVLKRIGSSPTELVNSAYEYVLEYERLPKQGRSLEELAGQRRAITEVQRKRIEERRERITFFVPASFWEGKSDDEALVEAMRMKYESLA